MVLTSASSRVGAPRLAPASATLESSRWRQPAARRRFQPAARQSARTRLAARSQRADAQQSAGPAPAQQSSKAAEQSLRTPEETAARQRFEAQAGQDSGDQGLQKALLNSALALLEEAAAARKVMCWPRSCAAPIHPMSESINSLCS